MNIKWKAILITSVAFVTVYLSFIFFFIRFTQTHLEEKIDSTINASRITVHSIMDQNETFYTRRMISLVNSESSNTRREMIEAFRDRDREQLFTLARSFFELLQKENPYISSMGWILPDNHHFLRINNPDKFGDDISQIRPDIVLANREQRQITGYATSRSGFEFRIVQPVSYEGQHLGVVQLGINPELLTQTVINTLHSPAAIVVPNDTAAFMTRPKLSQHQGDTHTIITRDPDFFQTLSENHSLTQDRQKITLNGSTLMLAKEIALTDFTDTPAGHLLLSIDISEEINQRNTQIWTTSLLTLFLALTVLAILYVSFNNLLSTIFRLNDTLKKQSLDLEDQVVERSQQLQEQKDLLTTTIDAIPDIICLKDGKGRWQLANEFTKKLLNLNSDTYIGKDASELAPQAGFMGSVLLRCRTTDLEVLTTGQPSQIDETLHLQDGSNAVFNMLRIPIFNQDGSPRALVTAGRDLTPIHLAKQQEASLAKIIEDSLQEIFLFDKTTFRIVLTNRGARENLGYTSEELKQLTPYDIKPEFDREHFIQLVAPLDQDRLKLNFETVHERKNGSTYPVDIHLQQATYNGQDVYVAMVRDTTQQKELEKKLRQSKKMEAIGTLAGGIAHDFNNILTAILGYAELAQRNLPAGSPATDDIREITRSGLRASKLVKQILAFSRKDTKELVALDPRKTIHEALCMLRSTLPTSIAIQEDIKEDCGLIMADTTGLHQIVINLCTNGVHAMQGQKGTLGITLRSCILKPTDKDPERPVGPYLKLTVSDTGKGMDQVTMKRLYEPYFTTKELGQGTGLGLSVIHGLVADYNGFIETESIPGSGSSFHIYLPLTLESSEKDKNSTAGMKDSVLSDTNETSASHTGRILTVDDESLIVQLHQRFLKDCGYQVTAISDSQQALELIQTVPQDFDLIITDQTMPHLTGLELAHAIHGIRADLPIILCTGHSDLVDQENAQQYGISAYFDKPVDLDALSKEIKKILGV